MISSKSVIGIIETSQNTWCPGARCGTQVEPEIIVLASEPEQKSGLGSKAVWGYLFVDKLLNHSLQVLFII